MLDKKECLVSVGAGAIAMWGISCTARAVARLILPRGAKFMTRLGVAVGVTSIGLMVTQRISDTIDRMIENVRIVSSGESEKGNESDETEA